MSNKESPVLLYNTTKEELINEIIERVLAALLPVLTSLGKKEIMSPEEVEKELGMCHQTRINLTKRGVLISHSYGGRKIYYKRSELISSLIKIEY